MVCRWQLQLLSALSSPWAAAIFVPVAAVGIATAVLVDPMRVAVTQDGYWIVIDEWWV